MNAPRRHLPRPTRRGVGVVVAGALLIGVGLGLSSLPLVFAGVALVALVFASLVGVAIRVPSIEVSRRFAPDRAVAGWSVVETVTLVAPGSRSPVSVRVRDTVAWRVMHSSEGRVTTIPGGGAATVSFLLDDLPRGRHRVGPALVDVVEAFGVARRLVSVPGRSELTVLPEVVPVGRGRESRALGETGRQRRDHTSGGQDDPITREYRRGDAMRRVHWKATARQGELMVRQEEQHGLPSARVVLPTDPANWRDAHPALGSKLPVSDGFEWAVSAAASIAIEFGLAGSETRVVTLDGSLLADHDPAMTPLFLEMLADITLGDEVDLLSPEPAPREPVIAVVSSLAPREIDALGRSRGPGVRGVAVVVHLDSDPLTPDDSGEGSPGSVARALRETGWLVVETDSVADVAAVLQTPGVFGG
ncbi:DUF58 domain-containing protein [Frondihabitans australicus]|uniref:Uncharacterized protein (DUF58 family) n=1 Tax=Frondihabitans australicus TaxID=386892 RepID=A0A495ICB8_9MICO|nr:DUF58 domain-containing protein [Frondihabitans australicus]RKR73654.1 uncharacterized protein (DUF58 family) [Frondihabitans australicus]